MQGTPSQAGKVDLSFDNGCNHFAITNAAERSDAGSSANAVKINCEITNSLCLESRTYRNELINKTRQQYWRRRDADKRLIKRAEAVTGTENSRE